MCSQCIPWVNGGLPPVVVAGFIATEPAAEREDAGDMARGEGHGCRVALWLSSVGCQRSIGWWMPGEGMLSSYSHSQLIYIRRLFVYLFICLYHKYERILKKCATRSCVHPNGNAGYVYG